MSFTSWFSLSAGALYRAARNSDHMISWFDLTILSLSNIFNVDIARSTDVVPVKPQRRLETLMSSVAVELDAAKLEIVRVSGKAFPWPFRACRQRWEGWLWINHGLRLWREIRGMSDIGTITPMVLVVLFKDVANCWTRKRSYWPPCALHLPQAPVGQGGNSKAVVAKCAKAFPESIYLSDYDYESQRDSCTIFSPIEYLRVY